MGFKTSSDDLLIVASVLRLHQRFDQQFHEFKIGGWGEESATGKSVSVSFRVRVVRAVRAGEAKLREGVRGRGASSTLVPRLATFPAAVPSGAGFRLGVLAEETRGF